MDKEQLKKLNDAIAKGESEPLFKLKMAWLKSLEYIGLILIKIGEWLRYGDQ